MRGLSLLPLLGILQVAVGQSGSSPPQQQSLFSSLVPQVTISVNKHALGADMIEMTMTASGYPSKLLQSQIKQLGVYLQSEPRGVQIWDYVLDSTSSSGHFTKATFAVDGVIDRKLGSFRLNPFAKALAGAPKPWTISAIEFQFQGETPTDRTLELWQSKAAQVEGRFENSRDPRIAGIEYRVRLLTQDAAKIDIPEPGDKPAPKPPKKPQQSGTDWTSVTVFLVSAGAVGALVYSLLLRGRPKRRI